MKFKKIIITSILTFTTLSLMPMLNFGSSQNDPTIFTYKKGYTPAKYEPARGTYLGAYVEQDVNINQSMETFNKLTGKKHASYFKYVGYGSSFPKTWIQNVKSVGAVPHIALEPNDGLAKVKDDKYLHDFAKDAKASGIPIFLRYASEMNGDWCAYSGNPKEYIKKWKIVHDVMQKEAPNVIMVWTVFTFPDSRIESYYPGDDYVDWVGVNIYNVVYHNEDLTSTGLYEDPLKLLDFVYNTYSYKKPIQISEYAATHFTVLDNKYHIDFAKSNIKKLYASLPTKYPRVKSIYYFDVNNIINAPAGRKINNYSLTSNKEILALYSKLIQNVHYISSVNYNKYSPVSEKLSYRGYLFERNDKLYVDIDFFKNYLGLKVTISGEKATLSNGSKKQSFTLTKQKISKGYYGINKTVRGLSLRNIAETFGYKLNYNHTDNSVTIF